MDPRIIRFGNTTLGLDGPETELITRHNQYFERIKGECRHSIVIYLIIGLGMENFT